MPFRRAPGAITELTLTPHSRTGEAWLIDAWGWRAGTQAPDAGSLPRVDVGELSAHRTRSGVEAYHVPVTVTGSGSGQVRFFVTNPETHTSTSRVATVRPGTRDIRVPAPVTGYHGFAPDRLPRLDAKAVRGLVVGDFEGGVPATKDR